MAQIINIPVVHLITPVLLCVLQSGVPRCGYRGIVSIMMSGRRVYLSPPQNWKGYDMTWK